MFYKCKLCGGQLDINDGDKLTTCPYCGSIQTIPNLEDEKINRLFERGNELIRNCQFDDAINKFEEVLSLRNDDPEVYWSLLMAKFGVIYEKDPYTGNMLPTIHRNQDISIYLDEDYKLTLQYADNTQLDYYNKQAKIIDNIQKKYNTIADREEPFDIFICYKQTDDNTKLDTEDYKIAYDLYNTLTNEGYKVFFSHITLEDKIGEEYEPYIYSALKSSKVLLAIGTKQEYYNAVWVKNEWSRFMYMMRNNHSKRIIPICTNTSILPNEFNKYQAIQTNNSIVWKEDLIRNIKKLIPVISCGDIEEEMWAENSNYNNADNSSIKNNRNFHNRYRIITISVVSVVIICLMIIGVKIQSNKKIQLNNEIHRIGELYAQVDLINFEIEKLESQLGVNGRTIVVKKIDNLDKLDIESLQRIENQLEEYIYTLNSNLLYLEEIERNKEANNVTAKNNELLKSDCKYPSGTVLYITKNGQGMGIKEKASIDSDFVDSIILDWGDKVTLVDDAVKDVDGNYWGKIDKGFIRIEYNEEIWASIEIQ